ncbi:hypothetical protein, partial [Nocardiopsis valliformis]|uniref:hypothetical protein n=1 Tax=Nocardiopsis valliformis TaxID=239974 RepID=UPI00195521D9
HPAAHRTRDTTTDRTRAVQLLKKSPVCPISGTGIPFPQADQPGVKKCPFKAKPKAPRKTWDSTHGINSRKNSEKSSFVAFSLLQHPKKWEFPLSGFITQIQDLLHRSASPCATQINRTPTPSKEIDS